MHTPDERHFRAAPLLACGVGYLFLSSLSIHKTVTSEKELKVAGFVLEFGNERLQGKKKILLIDMAIMCFKTLKKI